MSRSLTVALLAASLIAVLFLVYAPVVPYQRLWYVYYPSSPGGCSNRSNLSSLCQPEPQDEWLTSYGSFTYDAFGLGTAPYAGPVTFSKNGFTTVLVFNGTSVIPNAYPKESIVYPDDAPQPLNLITVSEVLVNKNGAPFGGTLVAANVTNRGTNETASVGFAVFSASPGETSPFYSTPQDVRAGESAFLNATSWVGPYPTPGTLARVEISGDICYGKMCVEYSHLVVVPVVSVTPPPKVNGGS